MFPDSLDYCIHLNGTVKSMITCQIFNHLLFKNQQKDKIGFKDMGLMNPMGEKNPEFKISN